jgi:hypothetical protein
MHMRTGAIAIAAALAGLIAVTSPAAACPNGYEAVWIQGHKVCRIKLPKLDLKLETKREPKKAPVLKAQ